MKFNQNTCTQKSFIPLNITELLFAIKIRKKIISNLTLRLHYVPTQILSKIKREAPAYVMIFREKGKFRIDSNLPLD